MTKTETRVLPIGTKVFCTVHGCEGWSTVLAIRPRDGYLKITGFGHGAHHTISVCPTGRDRRGTRGRTRFLPIRTTRYE